VRIDPDRPRVVYSLPVLRLGDHSRLSRRVSPSVTPGRHVAGDVGDDRPIVVATSVKRWSAGVHFAAGRIACGATPQCTPGHLGLVRTVTVVRKPGSEEYS